MGQGVNSKNLQFLPFYPIHWFPQLHKDQTYSKIANIVSSSTGEAIAIVTTFLSDFTLKKSTFKIQVPRGYFSMERQRRTKSMSTFSFLHIDVHAS